MKQLDLGHLPCLHTNSERRKGGGGEEVYM